MLEERWSLGKFLCVGLDSDFEKIPDARVGGVIETLYRFNRKIIDETHDIVCAYKPNAAFFEGCGSGGLQALRDIVTYIHKVAPNVPVIFDAKRGDIGNTNEGYMTYAFGYLGMDAITVNPYMGGEALKPFLDRKDVGIFVLCRTSNPGAGEFQDIDVAPLTEEPLPLYQYIAQRVAKHWNTGGNCCLVVGATRPDELREVRAIVGDMPILIPGIGAQGGDLDKTVMAGKDSRGRGMIINSSRGIIFAKDPRGEAEKLDASIRACLSPVSS